MGKVDAWLSWLVPRRCVFCNAPSGRHLVCMPCIGDLPWLPPAFSGAGFFAALAYEYPVDRLVQGAKFHRRLHHARALGELLGMALAARPRPPPGAAPELLLPVPLHRQRLVERGYNQTLEIARPVAERMGLVLAPSLARRVVATAGQTGLSRAARRRNLRGAFVADGCAGRRVAILDDVITTGSTAAALLRALRRAGAASVEVWAVARTL